MTRLALFGAVCLATGCRADIASIGALNDGQHETPDAAVTPPPDAESSSLTGQYFEAEDGALTGFTLGDSDQVSGGRYIAVPAGVSSEDAPGAARGNYRFTVSRAGTYLVWGRIHSPDAWHNTLWIRIDDGAWYLWRIATGDVFYWKPFHDGTNYGTPLRYELQQGEHRLTIANAVEGVELDRFYATADGDRPEGNDTPCHPPDSIQLDGVCVPSCGAQGGNACGSVNCADYPHIVAHDCDICCIVP